MKFDPEREVFTCPFGHFTAFSYVIAYVRGIQEGERTARVELIEMLEGVSKDLGWKQTGPVQERVMHLIGHYRKTAVDAVTGAKAFRDDVLPWFKAMELVLATVGNAETHREKNARLRGAVELLQNAVEYLRRQEFDFARRGFDLPFESFRSDLPTREFLGRIRELERELAVAKAQAAEPTSKEEERG